MFERDKVEYKLWDTLYNNASLVYSLLDTWGLPRVDINVPTNMIGETTMSGAIRDRINHGPHENGKG